MRIAAFLRDLPASLVVFLVAVPLALGIALASGAPVTAGLIGCVVGGIVAGSLSGAPMQVTGPAAGLTVLVFGLIQKFGWPAMAAITIAAGLLQILFGTLRIARASLMISPAVVHGMLGGIGVTIALAQLHVLLGDKPQSSALANLIALPREFANLFAHPTAIETHAAVIGLLTIGILIGWNHVPKRVKAVPGALAAVGIATLVGNLWLTDAPRVSIPEGPLFKLEMPALPADWGAFAIAALTIAVVASVESLLCAVATDKMHSGPRAQFDRELVAQGAANAVSGALGGLPVTGVIVRSAANVSAGAQTRVSAILHGVWVLLFVVLAANYLNLVPLAALAGLLVHVGLRLVNWHHIKELHVHREFVVYAVTLLGVTFLNLLAGVGLGIGLAAVLLLRRLSTIRVHTARKTDPDGAERWHVALSGTLSFLSVPALSAALAEIPPGAPVDIDLQVEFMDHAAFDTLHGWRVAHERTGGHVDIDEVHESWYGQAADGNPQITRRSRRIPAPRNAAASS